jgi:hypothetical protein
MKKIFKGGLMAGVSLLALVSLSGCATVTKVSDTVCANKARIIEASQAVIDTLNAKCPYTEEEILALEPVE